MKKIFFGIILLIFLMGCTEQQTTKEIPQIKEPKQEVVTEPTGHTEPVVIKQETVSKCTTLDGALDNLNGFMENPTKVERTGLNPNFYRDAKVGDCVTFLVGVRNELITSNNFFLEIEFREATTPGLSNTMSADRLVMKKWLDESDFSPKTLDVHEYKVFPIKLRIGEKRTETEETIQGTYRFTVQVYHKIGEVSRKKYEAPKEIFVKLS